MRHKVLGAALCALVSLSCATFVHGAGVKHETKSWAHDSAAFAEASQYISENSDINLLTFPGAKLVSATELDGPDMLTDGQGGVYGGSGRVAVNGSPSRAVYYLGKARKIAAINVFSGNIDERGNQDFEIRLANNASNPGVEPKFPEEATLTSGDKVLGTNGGAFLSSFSPESGTSLFDGEYDWVEFRFWKTYKVGAGAPGKSASQASSWGSMIEVQVLGDANDPTLFNSEEERAEWIAKAKARRLRAEIDKLGPDVAYSIEHRDSLQLAIEAMLDEWEDELGDVDWEERFADFEKRFADDSLSQEDYLALVKEYDAFRREVLLSHPVLHEFDEILMRKTTNPALMANWISNASRHKGKYDDSLVTLNLRDLTAPLHEITRGRNDSFIGDISLHWDADRCLVTALSDAKTWQVFECNLEDGTLRQVTPEMGDDVNNVEGCYVPDGSTIFVSSASMMGVPCIGGSDVVGNLYRVEEDGKTVRQLTFEQDQDWNPTILPNGRVMYLRWEYVDITHYYSRYVFTMNPDGTNQVEHYGSGGYWPNSTFYAKALPGQSSKFVGIVSGHHGVAREGELVIFDPSKGRRETSGVVQRIPGRNNPPENVTIDQLVDAVYPKFLFPYPLDDEHFLVSCRMSRADSLWSLYLVDVYDNMTLLRTEPDYHLLEPFALVERDEPTELPDRTVEGEKTSNIFITDVYFGQGLPKVPRGTVKKLRVYAVSYGYRGIGGHDVFGLESCWDGRRLLGDAPVYEDGSASFKIPANTPVFIQPLDENGAAVQLMRSWLVGMPGENQSCIGCHETQNDVSPTVDTIARTLPPVDLQPFYGPERPFTFLAEVQPILDKYCVGCHNGEKPDRPNFQDTTPGPQNFSNSYHALARYVRRPGPESDARPFQPMEYHVSTSELVKLLRKGHYNVQLDKEAWERLFSWIDVNAPYFGTWSEVANAGQSDRVNAGLNNISDRHVELKTLYADNTLNFESDSYGWEHVKRPEFVKPEKKTLDYSAPSVSNWPFDAKTARSMQVESASVNGATPENGLFKFSVESESKARVALNDELSIELVRIPAGQFVMGDENGFEDELPRCVATIENPFWMMTTEVTNAMYKLFDSTHDSRFIDQQWKDHVLPGYPANLPNQPVIRVNWQEATEFCEWLTEKTGMKFRLPTEAEWEWAARAGSSTPMWFGGLDADFGAYENLSDKQTVKFVVQGVNPQPIANPPAWRAFIPRVDEVDDGNMIATNVGSYEANPWGLYDMLGNVAEWTASDYKAYPYDPTDGRNANSLEAKKVARGGSWRDRPKWARAGVRSEYESWQRVFNVGFRVVCDGPVEK